MAKKGTVRLKRAYEEPSKDDGTRVLVERLWPRGVSKDRAAIDFWLKEVAPSTELRKWYDHDLDKWEEFRRRYRQELKTQGEILERLRNEARKGTVTLLFAAKDEERNNAVVLKEMLA